MEMHHIGVMVSDLERSVAWYERMLGLRVIERRQLGQTLIAFLDAGAGGAMIELVQRSGGYSNEGVVNHIAFTVQDLDAEMARLRAEGIDFRDEKPIPIWDGGRIAFFRGPDGELLELVQR